MSELRRGGIPTARGVDHFAVTVPDLEQAIAFFVDVVGGEHVFTTGRFEDPTGNWMQTNINVDASASLVIAMIRLGLTANLELFEYRAPGQRREQPKNSDIGGHHIAFYVDDITVAVEYLRSQPGVRILGEPTTVDPSQPNGGSTFVYFLSPWGMQMELLTAPNGFSYQSRTLARLAPPPRVWTNHTKESS